MNRFLSLLAALGVFYLIAQPNLVQSSSSGSWGNSASKLNLGVWIPPMTLRLPNFNMPKIKISATIKPRKNQPPMKIHLPEMSLNAKALGDDDNHGGSHGDGSYGGSGGGSHGGGDSGYGGSSYSSGGESYSSGPSYSSGGESYSGGGGSYNDYSSNAGASYRASASNQKQNNYQPSSNNEQYQTGQHQPNYSNQNGNEYNKYQSAQQDQRNAYYHVDQQPARYQTESVSYGASNNVQSGYTPARQSAAPPATERVYRSVQPLSNYVKREKGTTSGNSAYGYGVSNRYARN